jgi:hypothetical protein
LNISLFDTSIFFIRPTYSKKASSPTKQGEIMAMGIPLICNYGVGDTDEIVKKCKHLHNDMYDYPEISNEHINACLFFAADREGHMGKAS